MGNYLLIKGLTFDRISKLQKRAARIILHADFNTPSAEMFKELSWQRLKYNKAVFTCKAMNNLTLRYMVSETHNRTLRSSVHGQLAVSRSRSSLMIGHIRIQHPNCGIRFRFQFAMHHL